MITSAEGTDSRKNKGIVKGGDEWIRTPLNENLVIINLLYLPCLHSSKMINFLQSEGTAYIAILIKCLIQIPPNSAGKKKEIVKISQNVSAGNKSSYYIYWSAFQVFPWQGNSYSNTKQICMKT